MTIVESIRKGLGEGVGRPDSEQPGKQPGGV